MTNPLLQVEDLGIGKGPELPGRIVDGISLRVESAEAVGIVGESGSGKSMTSKAIAGLLPVGLSPSGSIRFRGEELIGAPESQLCELRGRQIALMLQDPFTMLNPLLRTRDQVMDGRRDGYRSGSSDPEGELPRRLREVGIPNAEAVAQRYPFELSGGLRQRVALAATLANDPALLIADEPSTALDVTTQREILELLARLRETREMSLILITHDLRVAFEVCSRVYVFYAGTVVEAGPARMIDQEPRHPYTLGLLQSEPTTRGRLKKLVGMEGAVPIAAEVGDMCPYAGRCDFVVDKCRQERPRLTAIVGGRLTACIRTDEIAAALDRRRQLSAEFAATRAGRSGARDVLVVESLVKSFPARKRGHDDVEALRGVSLRVAAAESVGLLGESGSGKTTLSRSVVGLNRPDGGRIELGGVDCSDYERLRSQDLRRARRSVQIVFQDPKSTLNPARTVGATLHEALKLVEDDSEASARALLQQVGLPPGYLGRKPRSLSGGERQRVAIARAIATKPDLLICDEPVSSLDVSVQAQILELLEDLKERLGLSLLFITHDLAVARQVVDYVYVLYQGQIVEEGAVDRVYSEPQHPYTQRLLHSILGDVATRDAWEPSPSTSPEEPSHID